MVAERLHHPIHPLHGIVLGALPTLFGAAFLADVTYLRTAQIQWSNFAQWAIAGGLIVGALALIPAGFTLLRHIVGARARPLLYLALLAGLWIVAFVNMLLHSRDGWYSVTITGAVLSFATTVLAIAAAWVGYSGFARRGEA
ncbi:DUF2231 domain-containing protein [Novosphingobium sp. JCM 18896]|uniref:DUF2231 domain-containing protein n=1 Tax=Novosphingobium sp. JCM 18896 TaxID=2989731 RepID=UPI002222A6A0|nr:DUF2231 domain-containing protein [Novosphingobium sp. JCM 18896]MCW1430238.1 hypothetical protein [Novosphingobium sp. JCM 18896]